RSIGSGKVNIVYEEAAQQLLEQAPRSIGSGKVNIVYEEAAQQLLEQAPRSPEYIPDPMEQEDHVPVYIPEPEHPEDLVPAEDEAPTPPLPPFFLSPRIRPPRTRAAMAQMKATAPSTYHPLLPSGTPPLLLIPLPTPSTSRRADILEADMPSRKRLLLTTPRPECEKDRAAVRAKIKVLRRERLAYEQESMETCQALARSEAYYKALEAQVTVLETEALEAGARIDTLEDTGSSS
ncbi:hypothetical protein Tco_0100721, partial [Tanacetum coccineum]